MATLSERLAALGVAPRRPAGLAGPAALDLRPRLERLRGKARGRAAVPERRTLADWVGGHWIDEGVVLVDNHVPWTERHGERGFSDPRDWEPLPGEAGGRPPERLLFFDTETTGLAGGTGTLVFLCGLARLGPEGIGLRQYLLAGPAAEPRFLAALAGELPDEAVLVSYNGRGFDRPLLTTRFRLNGQPDPLAGMPHLDLLSWVRRAFRGRWPDCRLVSVEQRLLGFQRTGDISGAEAPAAWLAHLRSGDGAALPAVLRHNRWDLLSLVALMPLLQAVYRRPEAFGAAVPPIARFLAARGERGWALDLLGRNAAALDPGGQRLLTLLARQKGEGQQRERELAGPRRGEGTEALTKDQERVPHKPERVGGPSHEPPPGERTRQHSLGLAPQRGTPA